jgi:hypothetical protein
MQIHQNKVEQLMHLTDAGTRGKMAAMVEKMKEAPAV